MKQTGIEEQLALLQGEIEALNAGDVVSAFEQNNQGIGLLLEDQLEEIDSQSGDVVKEEVELEKIPILRLIYKCVHPDVIAEMQDVPTTLSPKLVNKLREQRPDVFGQLLGLGYITPDMRLPLAGEKGLVVAMRNPEDPKWWKDTRGFNVDTFIDEIFIPFFIGSVKDGTPKKDFVFEFKGGSDIDILRYFKDNHLNRDADPTFCRALDAAVEKLTCCDGEAEKYKIQAAQSNERAEAAIKGLESLRGEHYSLEAMFKNERATAEQERQTYESRLRGATQQISELQLERQSLADKLDGSRTEIKRLNTQNNALQEKLVQLSERPTLDQASLLDKITEALGKSQNGKYDEHFRQLSKKLDEMNELYKRTIERMLIGQIQHYDRVEQILTTDQTDEENYQGGKHNGE